MWPSTAKGSTSCRPGLFWDHEQNSIQNIIKKIKGNIDIVKIVFPKVSLQFSGLGIRKLNLYPDFWQGTDYPMGHQHH